MRKDLPSWNNWIDQCKKNINLCVHRFWPLAWFALPPTLWVLDKVDNDIYLHLWLKRMPPTGWVSIKISWCGGEMAQQSRTLVCCRILEMCYLVQLGPFVRLLTLGTGEISDSFTGFWSPIPYIGFLCWILLHGGA